MALTAVVIALAAVVAVNQVNPTVVTVQAERLSPPVDVLMSDPAYAAAIQSEQTAPSAEVPPEPPEQTAARRGVRSADDATATSEDAQPEDAQPEDAQPDEVLGVSELAAPSPALTPTVDPTTDPVTPTAVPPTAVAPTVPPAPSTATPVPTPATVSAPTLAAPPVSVPPTLAPVPTPIPVPAPTPVPVRTPIPPPPPLPTVTPQPAPLPVPTSTPVPISAGPPLARSGPAGVINQIPSSAWRWLSNHGWTVDWRQGPGPGRISEAQYATSTIVIWYETRRSDTLWAGAFAHELGHAVSYVHFGNRQMNEWNAMRGLRSWRWVPGTPNDFGVGEGDFAEAFMSYLLGHQIRSIGGPLTQQHITWISNNTPF